MIIYFLRCFSAKGHRKNSLTSYEIHCIKSYSSVTFSIQCFLCLILKQISLVLYQPSWPTWCPVFPQAPALVWWRAEAELDELTKNYRFWKEKRHFMILDVIHQTSFTFLVSFGCALHQVPPMFCRTYLRLENSILHTQLNNSIISWLGRATTIVTWFEN